MDCNILSLYFTMSGFQTIQFMHIFERKKSMNNHILLRLSWLQKWQRWVLLASILCLFVFGLSSFAFAPSAHAATSPGHASCSTAPQNSPWRSWSCDEFNQPCFGAGFNCPGMSIHLHADGVYNPVTQKIWQWHVTCQAS